MHSARIEVKHMIGGYDCSKHVLRPKQIHLDHRGTEDTEKEEE